MRKRRILIETEFSKLNTGYACIADNFIRKLHESNKYVLAEHARYCKQSDPEHQHLMESIPWKVYPNLPENAQEDQIYNSSPQNEFGAWKFEHICLDFQPDVIVSYDDYWMSSFIHQSPFRRMFKTVMMPTVDACSQHPEWIDDYCSADYIFTYTDFAGKVLREESGGLINLKGTTTPAVDTSTYRFIPNKRQHKVSLGLPEDCIIIGMTARNQRRKLYPDFAEAFVEFLHKANFENTENVFLYWHTSYPDVGWDIPTLVKNNGLSHKVLFTYFCNDGRCGNYFPSFYQDVSVVCPRCHQRSATLSNSQKGIDKPALANIYNLFDLYVQFITNEGLGIPMLEAAACGVPITGTYYSGTKDLIDKLQGHPINPRTMFMEAETGRQLSFPSIDELVSYIDYFVKLPDSIRSRMSFNTAELAKKHYGGWDRFASAWMEVFDGVTVPEISPWLSPIDYVNVDNVQCPGYDKIPSDEQFVAWLLEVVLRRPEWINSYVGLKMWRDLTWGRTTLSNLGFFANDMSTLGCKPVYSMLDRQMLLNMVVEMRKKKNFFEQLRWQHIQQKLIPKVD